MYDLKKLAGAVTLAAALSVAGAATASSGGTLGWSFAATGVGSCDLNGGCTPAHPPVYVDQHFQNVFGGNASSSSSDALRGLAHASADVGAGFMALPELHSDVTGGSTVNGAYSWNYSLVQGAIGYTWTGNPVDLAINTFVGALDYTNSAAGVGLASASFAILNDAARDPAVANLWFPGDGQYGFAANCSTAGAVAVVNTGFNFTKGHVSTTLAPTCGSPTFHLDTGDEFFFWARLETFEAVDGFVNASHTFKISLNPDLTTEQVAFVTDNVQSVAVGVSVPEPGIWAMLLLGLGGVGGLIRRRRGLGALAAV
jgi:hypothetical protein